MLLKPNFRIVDANTALRIRTNLRNAGLLHLLHCPAGFWYIYTPRDPVYIDVSYVTTPADRTRNSQC